jgi:beta-lactamase superfamily II metal-dependent hydrolase
METLRIRIYSVQFGDAIFVSVPDRDSNGIIKMVNILIDVGNALVESKGGVDKAFDIVIKDVIRELNGQPLDFYIMTHQHMDHVQGLPYAQNKFNNQLQKILKTRYSWLTASAAPNYYEQEKYKEAERLQQKMEQTFAEVENQLMTQKTLGANLSAVAELLLTNNNPRKTSDCVNYLRNLGQKTSYVHRQFDPQGTHPFNETKIEIWAPEENKAFYFADLQPQRFSTEIEKLEKNTNDKKNPYLLIPPPGVDAGTFYSLLGKRDNSFENLLAIDQTANNTSIVFCLEWRGYRLLFTGDAEQTSWKKMSEEKVLKSVNFLKVSHHGSQNGTPTPDILDRILPEKSADGKPRYAAVSTSHSGDYHNVPDNETLKLLRRRCDRLFSTETDVKKIGQHFDIEFRA